MGFVSFDKNGHLLDAAGNQVHIVGINYVASYICTNYWEDWRPDRIEQDLARIHEMGLQAVRIPMHWGFMEPEPGKYNPVFEDRFRQFVELCRKYDLYIMPWLLVGVATGCYDVPYRNGRSFFTGEMVQIEEAHLKHFIEPYKDEELILFWDICDEPEWYSMIPGTDQLPYKRAEMARWVKTMYDAIRSVDPNHLITLGFGHIATENYGMDVRDMADILDLMVVTAYPGNANERIDSCRNNYCIPFHVKVNTRGKPVFTCEAPGESCGMYAEDVVGRYFKTSLYSNLLAGSTGVLPWVFNDFEKSLWHDVRIDNYGNQISFGIVTEDGRLRPSGEVLAEYAAFAKKAELGKYRPKKAEAAVLITDDYYAKARHAHQMSYTTMLLAKGCGVDVDMVFITEDLSDYKVLILPIAMKQSSGWDKVRRFVENGGVLYFICESGATNGYFNRLFGVEIQTYETDYGYETMTVQEPLGCWKQGDVIPLTGTGHDVVLRVKPESAKVLCTFDDGEPVLLKNHYGKGTAYLATSPLLSGLMKIPCQAYLQGSGFALMDAVLTDAGITRTVICCDNPAVEAGCLVKDQTGEMLALLINHDNRPVSTTVRIDESQVPAGWEVRTFADDRFVQDGEELELEPAGVMVYRIVPHK